MNFFRKLFSGINGLVLMASNVKMFPASVLKGKRIAIIGPASSAYGTGKGAYIDGFDFVVRINKAALLIRDKKGTEDIGVKTDILFHSFFENEYSGGGPLDLALYDQLGIKYLVNPIPVYFGHRVTFNFYKKYLKPYPVYTLPKRPYLEEVKRFGNFRPTTGFCALKYFMESDFEELYIAGFTFFQTAYGDGYRDEMKSREATQSYIDKMQIHNPDIEFSEFNRIYQENRHKNIRLDEALNRLIKNTD